MEMEIIIIGYSVTAIIGLIIGYIVRQVYAKRKAGTAEAKADAMIKEAKTREKELLLSAKDEALKLKEESKREEMERRNKIMQLEQRLERREESLERRYKDLEIKTNKLREKIQHVRNLQSELSHLQEKERNTLEKIAALSKEEAKNLLLQKVEQEMKNELVRKMKKLEMQEQEELEKKARDVLSLAIQRCAVNHASETTSTTVSIPSDDMKGRIIGREGRNIKAIENLTGVEIIVDDTPEAIVISGFSPVRRQIAKMTLEKLMQDGRIHPGRIEDAVEAAKQEVNAAIKESGEAVIYDLGIAGFDPKLVHLLGRLRFRTSYGQNVLKHSLEVAHLSAILASELGADANIAKKAGLLHDIGKAVDHEVQGTHVEIGMNILRKFKIPEKVISAMKSHHEEYPPECLEAIIVQVADAISASRPGARKDTYENYIQRLEELENLASQFEGVEKVYAIQAGREIRVFVTPSKVDDLRAAKLAKEIAGKIEEELQYPGEIKVTVIRETRTEEMAR